MSNIPSFLQHLKCFDGWKVQETPQDAIKRYYEKHPKAKPKAKPKHTSSQWRVYGRFNKAGLPQRICEECGDLFTPAREKSRFCSTQCSGRFYSRRQYEQRKQKRLLEKQHEENNRTAKE